MGSRNVISRVFKDGVDITDQVTITAAGHISFNSLVTPGKFTVEYDEIPDSEWQYGDLLKFKGQGGPSFMYVGDDGYDRARIVCVDGGEDFRGWHPGAEVIRHRQLLQKIQEGI